MKTVTIKILKKSVMGVVEGLSATIAQHNPDVDFGTIWASDSEEPKLDIYYREAVTDLENELSKWMVSTTSRFDLQASADDTTLTIRTLAHWPPRLSGLLNNQIQNYLVHAVMAGWLNDFPEMKVSDYAAMGASDLDAVKEILLKKDFSFADEARRMDDAKKDDSLVNGVTQRTMEEDAKNLAEASVEGRNSDRDSKDGDLLSAEARSEDFFLKDDGMLMVVDRKEDGMKKDGMLSSVEQRHDELDNKDTDMRVDASKRVSDNVCQHFHQDLVDWSGGRPPYILR